jgi:hypothetical protein
VTLLFSTSCLTKQTNKGMPYSQKDILEYLERYDQETYHFFVDLEHPYFFTAGSRLTLMLMKHVGRSFLKSRVIRRVVILQKLN